MEGFEGEHWLGQKLVSKDHPQLSAPFASRLVRGRHSMILIFQIDR